MVTNAIVASNVLMGNSSIGAVRGGEVRSGSDRFPLYVRKERIREIYSTTQQLWFSSIAFEPAARQVPVSPFCAFIRSTTLLQMQGPGVSSVHCARAPRVRRRRAPPGVELLPAGRLRGMLG